MHAPGVVGVVEKSFVEAVSVEKEAPAGVEKSKHSGLC